VKRSPELAGLSRDHHAALVLARRVGHAAGHDDESARVEWQQVTVFFRTDLEPHFRIEEQSLLPALAEAGEGALVERTLAEHARLRELSLQSSHACLGEFSALLHAHIRFEEQVLFQKAQKILDSPALTAVGARYRAMRG
jgi:iron-sulfur cluster repair protein YtfE (RIC family)